MSQSDDFFAEMQLFQPYIAASLQRAKAASLDFAHYTSATNALRILRKQQITLRNAAIMNDFSEINHGEECLKFAWESSAGRGNTSEPGSIARLLDAIDPFLVSTVERQYDIHLQSRKTDTYLLSLVEHDDNEEGTLGRLSMWRAYGGATNVALVVNGDTLGQAYESPLFAAPVLYADKESFHDYFAVFVDDLGKSLERLRAMGRDEVLPNLLGSLHSMAITTKHPGFHEEREWRVVYAPWLASSDAIEDRIIEVDGIPQRSKIVNLKNEVDLVREKFSLPELLKKIIIGPTSHPWVLYDAFVSELEALGVEDPHARVIVSNIPIRR